MAEDWRLEIEEKKVVLTFYSDTSSTMAPKVMSANIAARMLQLLVY